MYKNEDRALLSCDYSNVIQTLEDSKMMDIIQKKFDLANCEVREILHSYFCNKLKTIREALNTIGCLMRLIDDNQCGPTLEESLDKAYINQQAILSSR